MRVQWTVLTLKILSQIIVIKKHIHVNISSEIRLNSEHMDLSQFYSNDDESQKASSMISEKDNKMQDIYFTLNCHLLCHELETIQSDLHI